MVTVVNTTIGGTQPDHGTGNLWEAWSRRPLTVVDERHQGLIRDAGVAQPMVMSCPNTDGTRYRILRPDTNARHNGKSGSGARILPTYHSVGSIAVIEDRCVIIDLEISTGPFSGNHAVIIPRWAPTTGTFTLRQCLITGSGPSGCDGVHAPGKNWTISTHNTRVMGANGAPLRYGVYMGGDCTLLERHAIHFHAIAENVRIGAGTNSWTSEGSFYDNHPSSASDTVRLDGTTTKVWTDCGFVDTGGDGNGLGTDTNVSYSTPLVDTDTPGAFIVVNADRNGAADLDVQDLANNIAKDYIPESRSPHTPIDIHLGTRPDGPNTLGSHELNVGVVTEIHEGAVSVTSSVTVTASPAKEIAAAATVAIGTTAQATGQAGQEVFNYIDKTSGVLDRMGIKVTRLSASQTVWAPGTATQEFPGGWVTPGTYRIELNPGQMHEQQTGEFRGSDWGAGILWLVVKARSPETPGWIGHGHSNPNASNPWTPGAPIPAQSFLPSFSTEPFVDVTLGVGDVLHCACSAGIGFSRTGSDGIEVYCVATEPLPRGGLWGTSSTGLSYDAAAWATFQGRCQNLIDLAVGKGGISIPSPSDFYYGPTSLPAGDLGTDYQQGAGLGGDNEMSEVLSRWIFYRGLTHYRDGSPLRGTFEEFERLVEYFFNHTSYAFCFSQDATEDYFCAHGINYYEPYATQDCFLGLLGAVAGGFTPQRESLRRVLSHFAQRLEMTMAHFGDYLYGNISIFGGIESHKDDTPWAQWLYYEMGATDNNNRGGGRQQCVWGFSMACRELLGFPVSTHEVQHLYSDTGIAAGAAQQWEHQAHPNYDPNDRHGHGSRSDGVLSGYDQFYSSLHAIGAMMMWMMLGGQRRHSQFIRHCQRSLYWDDGASATYPQNPDTQIGNAWYEHIRDSHVSEVTGLAVNVSGSDAALSWDASSDGDHDHYEVWRGTGEEDMALLDGNVGTTSYTDVGQAFGGYVYALVDVTDQGGSVKNQSVMNTPVGVGAGQALNAAATVALGHSVSVGAQVERRGAVSVSISTGVTVGEPLVGNERQGEVTVAVANTVAAAASVQKGGAVSVSIETIATADGATDPVNSADIDAGTVTVSVAPALEKEAAVSVSVGVSVTADASTALEIISDTPTHGLPRAGFQRPDNATAYDAGDVVSAFTAPGFIRVRRGSLIRGGSGLLQHATITINNNLASPPDLELLLFSDPPTGHADNEALALSSSDLAKLVGVVQFSGSSVVVLNSAASPDGMILYLPTLEVPRPYVMDENTESLYALLVTRSGFTPAANDQIFLTLNIKRN